MSKLIWLFATLFLATLLVACAPESKSGLFAGLDEDEGGVEAESAEVAEFVALCEKQNLSTTVSATIKTLLQATESETCEDAATAIVEEQSLDLTEHEVRDLEPILVFKSLRSLFLSATGLSQEQAGQLVLLYNLETLDLSANGLAAVPELPVRLTKLDLSENRISAIRGELKTLIVLSHLSLRANGLARLPALPPSLLALDIGDNPAERELSRLSALKSLPKLRELYLTRKVTADKLKPLYKTLSLIMNKPLTIQ